MATSITNSAGNEFSLEEIPPLESGDRLTRAEFERRWEAMPNLKRTELIIEIASSSASYDLGVKLNAYRRNGVREYVVWRVLDGAFDWFVLHEGEYRRQPFDEEGILRSTVFPGLWLNTLELLAGRFADAFRTLDRGLSTTEHQAFVQRLASSSS